MKNKVVLRKLSDIGTLERGKGLQKNDFIGNGIPCIHYGQIFTHYNGFTNSTISFVSPEVASGCTTVRPGDIILALTSENVQDLCKSTVWLGEGDIVTGGHSGVFRHNQNPKYLGYFFQSEFFQRQKAKYARGTKVIEVNPKDIIDRVEIKLPDLETQRKIVQVLNVWMNVIKVLDLEISKNEELLEKYRAGLSSCNDAKIVRLGDITSMCSGGTPSSKNDKYYGGNILWASIADMTSARGCYLHDTNKKLTEEGFNSSSAIKMHPEGSILYAMYASIGECIIAGKDMASSQAILGIECKDKIFNKFLYHYLINERQKIKILGQQGTQSNLNAKIVKNIKITLPNLSRQKDIAHRLDMQLNLINGYKKKKNLYFSQYKYLLNHLISGDFDLSKIELEKEESIK